MTERSLAGPTADVGDQSRWGSGAVFRRVR